MKVFKKHKKMNSGDTALNLVLENISGEDFRVVAEFIEALK